MKYINCNLDTCIKISKKIVLFGAGQNLLFVEYSKLSLIEKQISYIVDNGDKKSVRLWEREVPVFKPPKLKEEQSCAVIITTSKYTIEMYKQLEDMTLGDDVDVYIFPFMQIKDYYPLNEEQRGKVFFQNGGESIPRLIHSFWFSGSKKPIEYQKCIDTWKELCPDFEIKEWNLDNYAPQHPFFDRAISVKAWAYATDYARLDVTSRYGGIYMDMDVELVKALEGLLCHKGVFPFCSDGAVELAMFMTSKNNAFINELLSLYDDVKLPDTKEGFNTFYQPWYVVKSFVKHGVTMDGTLQEFDGNIVLPRHICMPLDYCVYELKTDDDTVAIHRANAGWHEEDYTKRRISANRSLKNKLEERT